MFAALVSLILVPLCLPNVSAAATALVSVTNNLPSSAAALRITFTGTNPDLLAGPVTSPPGGVCGAPTVTVNGATSTVDIVWTTACIATWQTVHFQVTSATGAGPIGVQSVTWFAVGGGALGGSVGDATLGGAASWTVLVYMDGDNDLGKGGLGGAGGAESKLSEMEQVGSTLTVKVAAQVDLPPAGVNAVNINGLNEFRTAVIPHAAAGVGSPLVALPAEPNMADPDTLAAFLNWGMTTYPAKNYAVVLWDHGGGWKGLLQDETAPNALMPMRSLQAALAKAPQPIGVLAFDMCMMASVEVADQVHGAAPTSRTIMTGSQDCTFAGDWPYQPVLQDLNTNPEWTAKQLGTGIVARYAARNAANANPVIAQNYVQSAIDVALIPP